MKPTKKINGANELTPEQEELRMRVVESELTARYWKAQHDIRFYTLGWNNLQEPYLELIEKQQKNAEEMREQVKKNIEALKVDPAVSVEETDPEETTVYDPEPAKI